MVNHIKQFRQKKKLTQKELAKELGITQTVVGKYEHGDISPRPDKWQKMADFFGVSVSWLNGDWISTSVPYEVIKDQLLTECGQYIEVPGTQGNKYMIKVDNITCIEQELPNYEEEKK